MAIAKVILNGTTLMDVTDKTVTSANLLSGYTALKNDGTTVTGEYVPSGATLQSKTVSPSTSQQTVSPDSGYDGLSSVTVNAMPSGSASTPATTITANPTISVDTSGLITASVSGSKSVTPTVSAGYVSSGTAGTITVNGSSTSQLTVYNGAHHAVSSGYTVTVSLTNPVNASEFYHCYVYEAVSSDPTDPDNVYLGEINSPTGSGTYNVTPTAYGIAVRIQGSSPFYDTSNITCTGGVSIGTTDIPDCSFEVTADGTITIDGIDYDD